jgi:hypothetical protein
MYRYLLFSIIILIPLTTASLTITEIMYNPGFGSDSDFEWVELYNNNTIPINLSSFTLNNKQFDDTIISPQSYLIIARELIDGRDGDNDSFETFYGNNDSIWNTTDGDYMVVDGSMSLSNTEATITLTNGTYSHNITYKDDIGGDGNNYSIVLFNGTWLESEEVFGSPGKSNTGKIKSNITLSFNLKEPLYTGQEYTSLFKIKLDKKNCSEKTNHTLHYNLSKENTLTKSDLTTKVIGCSTTSKTGLIKVDEGGNYTLCGYVDNTKPICNTFTFLQTSAVACNVSLSISSENLFYTNKKRMGYYTVLNNKSFPYSIDYWVEDLFGEIIKKKVTTTNTNKKSFTPNIKEKDKVLFIKSKVTPSCNDSNITDNNANKMIIITNTMVDQEPSQNQEGTSTMNITKISPEIGKYGGVVKADVEIYKGSTTKYSISAFLEKDGTKISETTKLNLKDKYTNYKITLPLQLKPNCNYKTSNGSATIKISGLDVSAQKSVTVQGIDTTICRDYLSYVKEDTKSEEKRKLTFDIDDIPTTIKPGEEFDIILQFEGDDEKHKFEMYGYMYRGSKCYSCQDGDRDENLKKFTLNTEENDDVKLSVIADEALKEGEYNIMIKIKKDSRKTLYSLRDEIRVKEEKEVVKTLKTESPLTTKAVFNNTPTILTKTKTRLVNTNYPGITVYESSSTKAKKLIPKILALTFGLLVFISIFKR